MKQRGIYLILAGLCVGAGLGLFMIALVRLMVPSDNQTYTLAGKELKFSPDIGSSAPVFELKDLSGNQVSSGNYHGKVVLVNFWATWCAPCQIEMPLIQKKYDEHKPDLVVLAVNFDESQDSVAKYVQELELTFHILLDPGGIVQKLYRVNGYPTTVFIDRNGIIRIRHLGLLTEEKMDQYLNQLGVN